MGAGWGWPLYILSLIAKADGAQLSRPPFTYELVALPQWHNCTKILPPFLWTESVTFFQPSACYLVYRFPAPGKPWPLWDQDDASVRIKAAPDLWV